MFEETKLSWLTAAEPLWLGHHAALAARLARPSAARLTEEQEALALGLSCRLVQGAAILLPLASEPDDIWKRWEASGLPGSTALAPALLARVEEFRWRKQQPQAPTPLFQPRAELADAVIAAPAIEAEPNALEIAYLHLRVADGFRSNALGQPLLLPQELPPPILRALLLDIAAQDLAMVGDGQGRAADMAHAIDAALARADTVSIDGAARRYFDALLADKILSEVASVAVSRRDWLAVIALLAAEMGVGFSRVAAALLAASDDQIAAALGQIGVAERDAGPLLDALGDVPGRPDPAAMSVATGQEQDTMAAVAARTAKLRGEGG